MVGSSLPTDGPHSVVVAIPHDPSAARDEPQPESQQPQPIPLQSADERVAENPAALSDGHAAASGAAERTPAAGAGKEAAPENNPEPDPDMFADADEDEERRRAAEVAAAAGRAPNGGATGGWDEISDPSELGKRRRESAERDAEAGGAGGGGAGGAGGSLSPADIFADAEEEEEEEDSAKKTKKKPRQT